MKYILVIGDGMADDALPELGGKTPLEFAQIPAMDSLAGAGTVGTVQTIPDGMPPGSDTAIMSIFGCDPRKHYFGRAPLEAAATGIELYPGDIAYRCNMITIEESKKPFEQKKLISHSAGGIEGGISDDLISELFSMPGFRVVARMAEMEIVPGGSFRHIAIQKRPAHETGKKPQQVKSALIPPHDHIGEQIGELLPQGSENAQILSEMIQMAHEILKDHPINKRRRSEGKLPANGIWFWAEGTAAELPDFKSRYGKSGSIISAVPLCQGIGVLMGLRKITVQGATGDINTNYEGKAEAVFEALKINDFAAVHIEAPDECTHDGDLKNKLLAVERIDFRLVTPLLKKLRGSNTEFRMLVISDHKTLMSTRGHSGAAVPYLLYDSRHNRKSGLRFCEVDAKEGRYVPEGTMLMRMLFDDAD